MEKGVNISRSPHAVPTSWMLLACVAAVVAQFFWEGRYGFSLADEGFLWYGAQRVLAGEVPVRDFMAYDPGRYYVSAAWMALWADNGVMVLRGALAIVQGLGLLIGLLLLTHERRDRSILWLLTAMSTLMVWMFPRHRMFDVVTSLGLLYALTRLASKPSGRRFFVAGIAVGLAAVFGQNHGVYGLIASLGVIGYASIRRPPEYQRTRGILVWGAGVVVGFSPVLVMLAAIPGFATQYWEGIRFLFEIRATNLPLPVPWPWLVSFSNTSLAESMHDLVTGLFFVALALFAVAGIAWILRGLRRGSVDTVVTASAFLALPYAHFTFSRADLDHLAQGVFPFLVGSLAFLGSRRSPVRWSLSLGLCAASLLVMVPKHPGVQCRYVRECVEAQVGADLLRLDLQTAEQVGLLHRLAADFAPAGGSFVAVPYWPGAYALLGRRSPMWSIYALFPRGLKFQEDEIDRIRAADPAFIVIMDHPLDGRDALRFSNTHSVIDRFLTEAFTRLDGYSTNPNYQVLVAPRLAP